MKTNSMCSNCNDGAMQLVIEDYAVVTEDGNTVIVPGVELLRCHHCGETLIPARSSKYISQYLADEADELANEELLCFVKQSSLTQKGYAKAHGFGAKTINRWLSGSQVISRSMGYYLRITHEFPDVFAWLKRRGWKKSENKTVSESSLMRDRFPALAKRQSYTCPSLPANPAREFALNAIHLLH